MYWSPIYLGLWLWMPLICVKSAVKFDWCWAMKAVNGICGPWRCAQCSFVLIQVLSGTVWKDTRFCWPRFSFFKKLDTWIVQCLWFMPWLLHTAKDSSDKDSCSTLGMHLATMQCSGIAWSRIFKGAKGDYEVGTGNLSGYLRLVHVCCINDLFITCSALCAEPIMLKSLMIMLRCTAQEMCSICTKLC